MSPEQMQAVRELADFASAHANEVFKGNESLISDITNAVNTALEYLDN